MTASILRHSIARTLLPEFAPAGWTARLTQGNHIRFDHPKHGTVFTSGSPSDRRAVCNARAKLRRMMRGG